MKLTFAVTGLGWCQPVEMLELMLEQALLSPPELSLPRASTPVHPSLHSPQCQAFPALSPPARPHHLSELARLTTLEMWPPTAVTTASPTCSPSPARVTWTVMVWRWPTRHPASDNPRPRPSAPPQALLCQLTMAPALLGTLMMQQLATMTMMMVTTILYQAIHFLCQHQPPSHLPLIIHPLQVWQLIVNCFMMMH